MSLLAPLTLPLASLLALPLFSSWSTSLNLLFFSLTWTTIAMSYSPLQLELFGPIFIKLFLYLLPSTFFLLLDTAVPSLAVEVKAQGEHGLPSRTNGRGKTARVVGWAVVNSVLGVAVQVGSEWLVTDVLRMRSLLLVKGSSWSLNHLPNPWGMAKHLVLGIVARNTLSYYIHRFILHPQSPTYISRLHNSWHHSIRVPYSFVAAYDHPLCYILLHTLPLYLPAILLRMHILTYLLLLSITSLENLFTYSGYTYTMLPSTIMLRGMARRTDAHMLSGGKGNFGPTGVLDWACGTGLGQDVMDDVRAEMDKHDVKERAAKKTGEIGQGIGETAGGLAERMKQGGGGVLGFGKKNGSGGGGKKGGRK